MSGLIDIALVDYIHHAITLKCCFSRIRANPNYATLVALDTTSCGCVQKNYKIQGEGKNAILSVTADLVGIIGEGPPNLPSGSGSDVD